MMTGGKRRVSLPTGLHFKGIEKYLSPIGSYTIHVFSSTVLQTSLSSGDPEHNVGY